MGFKCGIVGLPNVGKSTLFNSLTNAGVASENYPFCTIEPHLGVVPLPDKRLDELSLIVKPQKTIPTSMEFVDIAGLVKGASKGEGLGNQFLANIRETDAIAHVVRCFEDPDVIHVDGRVDPVSDADVIQLELILTDIQSLERGMLRLGKLGRSGDKEAKSQLELYKRMFDWLMSEKPARLCPLSEDEKGLLYSLHLLTMKPVLYIANVDDAAGMEDNDHVTALRAYAKKENAEVVTICATMEAELLTLDKEERDAWLEELNWTEPGLDRVIHAGYKLLGLQTYYTAGVKEVRAWTVPVGSTAPQAAGKIHTDFEKGFIRAEIMGYDDFITHKGEKGCREVGKWRSEGKEYIVKDGDVIHFRFNV